MYAVIETGGKQHKVEEGQTLLIDLISDDKKKITFDNVLLYSDDKTVEIGQPYPVSYTHLTLPTIVSV